MRLTYRTARRCVVALLGTTLLAIGAILLFTPGPAVLVIALGLAVLAAEFAWARRWLRKLKQAAGSAFREGEERGPAPREPQ